MFLLQCTACIQLLCVLSGGITLMQAAVQKSKHCMVTLINQTCTLRHGILNSREPLGWNAS